MMNNALSFSCTLGGSAPASRRAATISWNQLLRPGMLALLACSCLSAVAQKSEWAWMSGSDEAGQAGIYGSVGEPAADNLPGARQYSSAWRDAHGDLWLFGGYGYDAYGDLGVLNDLWRFSPATVEWTWMGGSKTAGQPAVYGKKGEAASGNVPGAREWSLSWTDANGDFWLFGGTEGYSTALNDLWRYSPATGKWTWMSGSSSLDQAGVYGKRGQSAAANLPGARSATHGWTDASGKFWLFGGIGYDENGSQDRLNDLWTYSPATGEWTWMSGSETNDAHGVYGEKGEAATANVPGARSVPTGWTDTKGNLWLFGGSSVDGSVYTVMNDLWKYSISSSEWTWMGGSETGGEASNFGNLGVQTATNQPGVREDAAGWIDRSGNLWLFGGWAYGSNGYMGDWNDLWRYSVASAEWTWMGGSSEADQPGTYGKLGSPAAANIPGARDSAIVWADTIDAFWLLGGDGLVGRMNDLWRYAPVSSSPVETFTTLTSSANPASPGATVKFTAIVSSDSGLPGGSLTITVDNAVVANRALDSTSSATYSTTALTLGSHRVSASYTGNSSYAASKSSTLTQTISQPNVPAPVFSHGSGTYSSSLNVTLSDSLKSASSYYTTDGSTPSATHGTRYASAISVKTTETIKAVAVASGYTNSPVSSAKYVITQ